MAFDLTVFNSMLYTVLTETVDQNVKVFNEASNNVLRLVPSNENIGDFKKIAGFSEVNNFVRRRDVYNGEAAATPTRLTQYEKKTVKIAAGAGPVPFEPAQYEWIKQSPELAAIILGEQLAKATLKDQINTTVSALAAAISGNTSIVHTVSGEPTLTDLTKAASKFGDRLGEIRAWVVHSSVMTSLWVNTLQNSERLFDYGNVAVWKDPFGRQFIMSDIPALMTDDGYISLGLVENAAIVEPNNDFYYLIDQSTGKENIQRAYQAEWSYNIDLKGYSWDESKGGASPSDTAIGTAANWKMIATSIKDTAGVLLKTAA